MKFKFKCKIKGYYAKPENLKPLYQLLIKMFIGTNKKRVNDQAHRKVCLINTNSPSSMTYFKRLSSV